MIGRLSSKRNGIARRLARDSQGVTLTEFGLISPVLFMMIMGIFDIAHNVYTSSMVDGAMQSAARAMTIEGAAMREAQIDARVIAQVRNVVPSTAEITLDKQYYDDFSDVSVPEEFTDTNGDGICNDGESYVDTNNNNQWDADRGSAGIGGARDVVLYTVTVEYPRLFPIYNMVGMNQNAKITGSTVLRNQPYDEQNRVSQVRQCP